MNINKVDVVVGLAWGDEGKGKVTSHLAGEGDYSYVCRWAGGSNAGHTVYLNDKQYKTHIIPSGVFHGIPSIIGPGCVLNKEKFYEELNYLHANGFDINLVKVSPKTHIVQDIHIEIDKAELSSSLGTTSNGIAPCYAQKAARNGLLAKQVLPSKTIWNEELSGNILCEGAQGVWLDLDWGNYPYVTSSTTLPYGSCSLGFPPQLIEKIYGVAKIYDSRSGIDPLFPESLLDDSDLFNLGELGKEYGVTTGRRRMVQWLNLDLLIRSINITGTTDLIINKCDILERLGVFKLIHNNSTKSFDNINNMIEFMNDRFKQECPMVKNWKYSGSPSTI
tara:strand:+ start:4114 stop:5115 length:1002 start_codon:yes stop_codon:yes gene_type:complete